MANMVKENKDNTNKANRLGERLRNNELRIHKARKGEENDFQFYSDQFLLSNG